MPRQEWWKRHSDQNTNKQNWERGWKIWAKDSKTQQWKILMTAVVDWWDVKTVGDRIVVFRTSSVNTNEIFFFVALFHRSSWSPTLTLGIHLTRLQPWTGVNTLYTPVQELCNCHYHLVNEHCKTANLLGSCCQWPMSWRSYQQWASGDFLSFTLLSVFNRNNSPST